MSKTRPILRLSKDGKQILERFNSWQAVIDAGYVKSAVYYVIKGQNKHHRGYTFAYEDAYNKNATETQSNTDNSKTSWDESSTTASFEYKGTTSITTLEQALEFADVDLDVWEVERWRFNSWDVTSTEGVSTNYQVRVDFKRKHNGINIDQALQQYQANLHPIRNIKLKAPTNISAYIGLADFHAGAYVDNLIKTPSYNYNILSDRLTAIAGYINAQGFKNVHVGALGDFIESFTGLNHANSWKGLQKGAYGAKSVMLAVEILADFLGKINNLSTLDLVAGNHDRTTSKSDEDVEGQVAELIYEFMRLKMPELEIAYNPLILKRTIDDVCYVQTHGHHGISKRPISDVLFDYGEQENYNILVSGHWHSRRKKEMYKVVEGVQTDKASYRAITLPPLFTGNFYSESNGWNSTAGFVMLYKNQFGKLEQRDVCL